MPQPLDQDFWEKEAQRLAEIMRPWEEEAAKKGIAEGRILLGEAGLGLTLDWDLVNNYARAWAVAHTAEVVAGITQTSMTAFVEAFPAWVGSGEHLNVLIADLAKHYEPWRAEMIGVTETTRAFSAGNHTMWNASGIVDGTKWLTGVDEMVCPLCRPLHQTEATLEGTYPGGIAPPPRHVRCRCYEHPVIKDKATAKPEEPIPSPERPQSALPGSFADYEEAQRFAEKQWPNYNVSLAGMDGKSAHEMLRTFESLERQYPGVSRSLRTITTDYYNAEWDGQYANAYAYYMRNRGGSISLNPNRWDDHKGLVAQVAKDSKKKWNPVGLAPDSDGDYVFTHEFGHAIQVTLERGTQGNRELFADMLREFEKASGKGLGDYAKTNIGEKWAESFAQMSMAPEEQWTEATKVMRTWFQKPEIQEILQKAK